MIEEGIPLARAMRTARRAKSNDCLMARCEVCEDTGCWEWRGTMSNQGRTPVLIYKGKQISARRLARMFARMPMRDGYRTSPGKECSDRCINPKHTRHLSPADYVRATVMPNGHQSMSHRAAVTLASRRRCTSLIGDVGRGDEIRRRVAAGESRKALALEFGCSETNIGRVARSELWVTSLLPGSSVFAWGGA